MQKIFKFELADSVGNPFTATVRALSIVEARAKLIADFSTVSKQLQDKAEKEVWSSEVQAPNSTAAEPAAQ